MVAPNPDRAESVHDAKRHVAGYASIAQYESYYAAHGFGAEARRLQEAVAAGDPKAADLVPDDMARTFVVCGTPGEVAATARADVGRGRLDVPPAAPGARRGPRRLRGPHRRDVLRLTAPTCRLHHTGWPSRARARAASPLAWRRDGGPRRRAGGGRRGRGCGDRDAAAPPGDRSRSAVRAPRGPSPAAGHRSLRVSTSPGGASCRTPSRPRAASTRCVRHIRARPAARPPRRDRPPDGPRGCRRSG